MKRGIVLLTVIAGLSAIIVPFLLAGPAPETNISLGGITPEMTDESRTTEIATFALG